MSAAALRAIFLWGLAGSVSAGQIEAPVAGELSPGGRTGAAGSSLGAPIPIQLSVPSLAGAGLMAAAPAVAPVPLAVAPAAAKPIAPAAAKAAAPPVLPKSAVTAAGRADGPRALAEGRAAAPSAPDAAAGDDAGRIMFDQGGARGEGVAEALAPVRSIVRRSESRSKGWEVDGRPTERLSAGGFKEVLIHPGNPHLVIKVFALTGAKDAAGSLSEKRLEMRNLLPLLDIGRAPRVVEQGALELRTPSSGGKRTTGYIVQERVFGRELGDMLRDPDPAIRGRALKEARALFEDLIAARIKLEDEVNMHENISVGRAGGGAAVKAWVLDAGESTLVAGRGTLDKLLGRPDPLRGYYEKVLAALSRLPRR